MKPTIWRLARAVIDGEEAQLRVVVKLDVQAAVAAQEKPFAIGLIVRAKLLVEQLRPAHVAQQDVHHDGRADQTPRTPIVRDREQPVREPNRAVAKIIRVTCVLEEAGRHDLRQTHTVGASEMGVRREQARLVRD